MLESFAEAVFDPLWNAAHRATIWGTIIVVLFLSGLGFPLPEDVPLTASGFTTFKQAGDQFVVTHYLVTFLTVCVPILLGDLCAYSMGRRFGFGLRDRIKPLRRVITDERIAKVQRWYDEYGSFTVFLGRQVAGVRFVTFYTAGTMRMNIAKFVLWDFLGCLVSVPVWLTLGTFTARYGREWMEAASSKIGLTFITIVAILAIGLFVFDKYRKRAKAAREQATDAPAPTPDDAPPTTPA